MKDEVIKNEFCKTKNCMEYNGMMAGLKCCDDGCIYSVYDFGNWLTEKGLEIEIKRKVKRSE